MKPTKLLALAASAALFVLAWACQTQTDLEVAPEQNFGALPLTVLDPADNPRSPEKIALGKLLFYDPILSGNKDVSCATCHHPRFGYADGLDLPIGVGGVGQGAERRFSSPGEVPFTKRNTPSLLNVAFNGIDPQGRYDPVTAPMFFDLRAASLEAQSLMPIAAFEEMRGKVFSPEAALDSVVTRLKRIPDYQTRFGTAFGGKVAVSAQNLGRALAAYERTLLANHAPFDRYRRGDKGAMTEAQKRGMVLFVQNGCNDCHHGPMFSDYKTHVLGVEDNAKLTASDAGRANTYAFRTPSLRNLTLTAPYMHNGRHQSLSEVLSFYDQIKDGVQLNPKVPASRLDSLLRPRVTLNRDLIEFMNALSDPDFEKTVPASVPSGLKVGGNL